MEAYEADLERHVRCSKLLRREKKLWAVGSAGGIVISFHMLKQVAMGLSLESLSF